MRLADWLMRHHQEGSYTNTSGTLTIVRAHPESPMGRELFALDDYAVATVWGEVVFMVPHQDVESTPDN